MRQEAQRHQFFMLVFDGGNVDSNERLGVDLTSHTTSQP